jgi:hypothetical protein
MFAPCSGEVEVEVEVNKQLFRRNESAISNPLVFPNWGIFPKRAFISALSLFASLSLQQLQHQTLSYLH